MIADDGSRPLDPWGTELRLEPLRYWYANGGNYYQFRSAGPDGVFDTRDDLVVNVMVRPRPAHAKHAGVSTRAPSLDPIDARFRALEARIAALEAALKGRPTD